MCLANFSMVITSAYCAVAKAFCFSVATRATSSGEDLPSLMTVASHKLRPPSVISDDWNEVSLKSAAKVRHFAWFCNTFPEGPSSVSRHLWWRFMVYSLWGLKLKTKMTIMTNDQMTTTLHFSLFTFHFEHSETRSLRSLVIKVKKDFTLSFRLTI